MFLDMFFAFKKKLRLIFSGVYIFITPRKNNFSSAFGPKPTRKVQPLDETFLVVH